MTFKFVSPQNRGVPDRLFIKDGKVIFIEFKSEGKKPNKLQSHIIGEMLFYGANVFVVDNENDLKAVLC